MTAASDTVQRSATQGVRFASAVVLVTAIVVVGLLLAGQAGLLPRSPAYEGPPGEQYLSQQTSGERFAAP